MSKKHFIALADELKAQKTHYVLYHGQAAFDAMVDLVISFCRGQNYRFKSDVFRGYIAGTCGPCGGALRH